MSGYWCNFTIITHFTPIPTYLCRSGSYGAIFAAKEQQQNQKAQKERNSNLDSYFASRKKKTLDSKQVIAQQHGQHNDTPILITLLMLIKLRVNNCMTPFILKQGQTWFVVVGDRTLDLSNE